MINTGEATEGEFCQRPGPKVSYWVQCPDNLLICDNCVAASVERSERIAAGETVKLAICFPYGTLKGLKN
jgi:hypothetical protein